MVKHLIKSELQEYNENERKRGFKAVAIAVEDMERQNIFAFTINNKGFQSLWFDNKDDSINSSSLIPDTKSLNSIKLGYPAAAIVGKW